MTDQAIASVINAFAASTSESFSMAKFQPIGCFPARPIPVTRVTLHSDAGQYCTAAIDWEARKYYSMCDAAVQQLEATMPTHSKSHDDNSPLAILTELAVEGTSSLVEAQRTFLNLVQQENNIIFNGVKERISSFIPAVAVT